MSGPLIPYIQLPEIPLSFLSYLPLIGEKIDLADPPTIKPFGTLVAFGVYLGSVIALRRARERGLDTKKLNDFIFWSIGMGFVGAHVLDSIFYYPDKVAKNPLTCSSCGRGCRALAASAAPCSAPSSGSGATASRCCPTSTSSAARSPRRGCSAGWDAASPTIIPGA